MSDKVKQPAVRFVGHANDWEQRKLGDITSSYSGGTPAVGNKEFYDGKIPFIRSGEIHSSTTELFINDKALDSSSAKMVRAGDILYALYGATSGEVSRSQIDGAINQAILAIIPDSEHDSDYLVEWLRKEKQNIITTYLQGGQGNLSAQIVKELLIPIATPEEQQKIGRIFREINNLITLQQRKYDKLVNVKKSLLDKMFPKKGAVVPEVRFAGFTEAWEQRKLGELGVVSMCKRIFKEQTTEEGDVPFYKIGTFGGTADAYISRELYDEFRTKYPYPQTGDILISASGSIGRTVEYTGNDEYFQDSNIVWLNHDERIANCFLKCFYQVIKWSGLEGSTIKRLYNETILNTEIALPSREEQEQIGSFFSNLDDLITLHQRKLEKLENIKNAFLEKIFI